MYNGETASNYFTSKHLYKMIISPLLLGKNWITAFSFIQSSRCQLRSTFTIDKIYELSGSLFGLYNQSSKYPLGFIKNCNL
ncbi:MAG TPA: hypothetical protein VF455_02020 [Chryseobacterium sp.]